MSDDIIASVHCAGCNARLTGCTLGEPVLGADGVLHAYGCPTLRQAERAPSPARGAGVTEEMVERALNAHDRHWTGAKEKIEAQGIVMNGERMTRLARASMRAALLAALTPPPGVPGSEAQP